MKKVVIFVMAIYFSWCHGAQPKAVQQQPGESWGAWNRRYAGKAVGTAGWPTANVTRKLVTPETAVGVVAGTVAEMLVGNIPFGGWFIPEKYKSVVGKTVGSRTALAAAQLRKMLYKHVYESFYGPQSIVRLIKNETDKNPFFFIQAFISDPTRSNDDKNRFMKDFVRIIEENPKELALFTKQNLLAIKDLVTQYKLSQEYAARLRTIIGKMKPKGNLW